MGGGGYTQGLLAVSRRPKPMSRYLVCRGIKFSRWRETKKIRLSVFTDEAIEKSTNSSKKYKRRNARGGTPAQLGRQEKEKKEIWRKEAKTGKNGFQLTSSKDS